MEYRKLVLLHFLIEIKSGIMQRLNKINAIFFFQHHINFIVRDPLVSFYFKMKIFIL